MVNVCVNNVTNGPQPRDTVNIYLFEQLFNFIRQVRELVDQGSQKFDDIGIFEENAKVQTVKKRHAGELNVVTVFRNQVNDLLVQCFLFMWLLFAQSVCFLKTIERLVVKVDVMAENVRVPIFDEGFHIDMNLVLKILNLAKIVNRVDHIVVAVQVDTLLKHAFPRFLLFFVIQLVQSVFGVALFVRVTPRNSPFT